MSQLCASCSYPKNDCDNCSVAINYLSLIPSDCSFFQKPIPDTSLFPLITELINEVHALTLEVQELKKSISK